jgi:hypothetical protein
VEYALNNNLIKNKMYIEKEHMNMENEEVEKVRNELYEIISKIDVLYEKEILIKSREMDELIVKEMKNQVSQ